MLYKDIEQEVLGHINQATLGGKPIAPFYNNQIDYLNRIPQLLNAALAEIRTSVKPQVMVTVLETGAAVPAVEPEIPPEEDPAPELPQESEAPGWGLTPLPRDCWKLKTGGVYRQENGELVRTNLYQLVGRAIHFAEPGAYLLEYYSYPVQLPEKPQPELDVPEDLEVLHAATYYAAANLVILEDEAAYGYLMSDYEGRLQAMAPVPTAETHPVEDVYSFGGDL